MSLKEAIKELERDCNTHFDSKIVRAFVQVIDKYKNVDEILDDLSIKDF
jgi:HD-GYP domain-containing protein (c-di-GMP phosphodiesterase class II)